MKRKNSIPAATLALFVVAIGLLLFSTIGGANAALTYYSETWKSEMKQNYIGVTLNENGNPVAWRKYTPAGQSQTTLVDSGEGTLLGSMIAPGGNLLVGNPYPERISVTNNSNIDTYVRVTITKYWANSDGNGGLKRVDMDPELIQLHPINTGDWILDTRPNADTIERDVYYYNKVLAPGATTSDLCDTFTISADLPYKTKTDVTEVIEDTEYKKHWKVTTTYDYDGLQFVLEARVDSVQSHSGETAIKSAWGTSVGITNGILTLY